MSLIGRCLLPFIPALLSTCAATDTRPAPPPNFVFILADDLGYGDLGCYGQTRFATPRLDRMAAEGLRLTQFYAGSTVCAPSRCVLMTGLHTGHCRIRGNARIPLRPDDITVAEILKGRGYATGLVGKWGLGEEGSPGLPTRQGFDEFFGYLNQRHAHNYWPAFLIRNESRVSLANEVPEDKGGGWGVATKREVYSHDLFAERALRFVENNRDRPFFLYLALTIPHANNEARQKGMEVPDHGIYADRAWPEPQKGHAAMIARMDRDVGRLLDKLVKLGIAKNTLVMFTSDNGPHREGGNNPDFTDSNGPLRGIKRDLYEGGIRVPCLAWWPGTIAPGRTSRHPAGFEDVLATYAELAGARLPQHRLDSVSFAPTLLGRKGQRVKPHLYWEFYERGSAQAVRAGRWKAIRSPMYTGKVELYDLDRDVGERNNVAGLYAGVADRLRTIMDKAHVPSPDFKVRPRRGRRRGAR